MFISRVVGMFLATLAVAFLGFTLHARDKGSIRPGYYRFPAIHGDMVIFTAEGDPWTVSAEGGVAHRLTSDPGMEDYAAISPDGKTVAFSAQYEGPMDAYLMPIEGGIPKRLTWDGDAVVEGWTPDGKVLIHTGRHAMLPGVQLVTVGIDGNREVLPLATGAEGSFTKRYKGGWMEDIWRYTPGSEAVELTGDYVGNSKNPMSRHRRRQLATRNI